MAERLTTYTPAQLADLREQVEKAEAAQDEQAKVIRAMADDSADFTEEKQAEYDLATMEYTIRKDKADAMSRQFSDALLLSENDPINKREPCPAERLMRGGIKALGDAERKYVADWRESKDGKGTSGDIPIDEFMLQGYQDVKANFAGPRNSTGATGRGVIPVTTLVGIVNALKAYGGIAPYANQFNTASGEPINVPQHNDTTQMGSYRSAELATTPAAATSQIGEIQFTAYTQQSGEVFVSNELQQDTSFDILGWVMNLLYHRLGRRRAVEFWGGAGTAGPTGITSIAKAGTAAASQTAITWEEMLNVQYDIDQAYLMGMQAVDRNAAELNNLFGDGGGSVRYVISRGLEQLMRNLKDGEGRPLWQPAITSGIPGMIHGYPYNVCFEGDAPAAGAVVGVFGNLSYFGIRNIGTMSVRMYDDSRTGTQNAVSFQGYCREDSKSLGPDDGGKNQAFVNIQMAA